MRTHSLTTRHTTIRGMWTPEVMRLEASLARLTARRAPSSPCTVSFFEIEGDRDLHVNVIHERETVSVRGWSGPAAIPDGYVLNRRFHTREGILAQVEAVVFADRA